MWIPPTIRDEEAFKRTVSIGQTRENLVLDFKRQYKGCPELTRRALSNRSGAQATLAAVKREAADDVAAFANTFGGVILLGVAEVDGVADEVVGVGDFEPVRRWLCDAYELYLEPRITVSIREISVDSNIVAVISVPASRDLVGVKDVSEGSYRLRRRTSLGNEPMTPWEALALTMDRSRTVRLAFRRAFERSTREGRVELHPRHPSSIMVWLTDLDDDEFVLTLVDSQDPTARTRMRLPYSAARDAWLTEDGSVGLWLRAQLGITSGTREPVLDLDPRK